MLPYIKNYRVKVFLYSVLPALAFVAAATFLTGRLVLSEVWGMLTAVALVVLGTQLVGRHYIDKASDEANRLVGLFMDDCDPQALVDEGAEVAERMKPPYDEWAAWFASYYCLALADLGRTADAARYADALRASMAAAKKPAERAAICLHMEPPVRSLLGAEVALATLEEAQAALDAAGVPAQDSRRGYIDWERRVLEAQRDGRDAEAADLLAHVRQTSTYQARMRAQAAWEESQAARRLGDEGRERECLRFVVERGNRLACAGKARARLAELG